MLKIQSFTFSPFAENTWVLSDDSGECVIVDPGCLERQEQAALQAYIEKNALRPVLLLNTHCHIDHIFGNAFVKRTWNLPLLAHELETLNREGAVLYAQMMGLPFDPSPAPDRLLDAGDTVSFGNTRLEVLFVPGHAAGHIAFWNPATRDLFSGDVLFQGSIGRTDLPGGNYDTLMRSIRDVLLPLGDDVRVHSGHGPDTTLGMEKRTNPFILSYREA